MAYMNTNYEVENHGHRNHRHKEQWGMNCNYLCWRETLLMVEFLLRDSLTRYWI
jgi:hypothetical protein